MKRSILVNKKCQKEGKITEHYYYPITEKIECAECIRTERKIRYKNPINKQQDLSYNKKWRKSHKPIVRNYELERKLKKTKLVYNFDQAKKDFIIQNLEALQLLHNNYNITMSFEKIKNDIGNINNTTISKIYDRVAKNCRRIALKHHTKIDVRNMDLNLVLNIIPTIKKDFYNIINNKK